MPTGEPADSLTASGAMIDETPTQEAPAAPGGAISDQPTSEYSAITPATGSHARNLADGPAPWPLPVGDVLEGRYRIEKVVDATPDKPGAENIYHVVDLRGYERCWSCGTQHGQVVAGERFCPQCGADMLGHEYLMTERREETDSDTRPELPTQLGDLEAAPIERVFARDGRRYQVTEIERERTLFPFGPYVTVTGATHVGLTRAGETNEDSFGSFALNLAHDSHRQPLAVAIVADGLGGHVSGQDASRIAVRMFIERLTRALALPTVAPLGSTLPPDEVVEDAIREAAHAANAAVYQANVKGAGDMGSTLVGLVIVGEKAWIINVGDSRAYVMDGDALRRITSDHSLVEQLILGGMITPEERYTYPHRNRIFRSLGGEEQVELDIFTQRLRPGMRLLLCSDGLWEMAHDPEIEQILRETESPYAACAALIAAANERGGEDNITAVIAQVDA
ncbi:MAG TPA: protein phosphatase 2C domain-containing protein [Ktedonobacterales bacterium]|nr:protein phosphatase 2C domain-containing protein [Ktedonobacterales bacterium]